MTTLTPGTDTSERKLTWIGMVTGAVAILAQITGKLMLDIDLGVDIDTALLAITGGGAAYTISRKILKGAVAKAEAEATARVTLPTPTPAPLPPRKPDPPVDLTGPVY